jgi:hypothetical protein
MLTLLLMPSQPILRGGRQTSSFSHKHSDLLTLCPLCQQGHHLGLWANDRQPRDQADVGPHPRIINSKRPMVASKKMRLQQQTKG